MAYIIPQPALECAKKQKKRIEFTDNLAAVTTALIQRHGKKLFEGQPLRFPLLAFEDAGIRRKSIHNAIRFLVESNCLEYNKGGKVSGLGRCRHWSSPTFRLLFDKSEFAEYSLQSPRMRQKAEVFKPIQRLRLKGEFTETHRALIERLKGFGVLDSALERVLERCADDLIQKIQIEHHGSRLAASDLWATLSPKGRLFSSYTNAPKVLRSVLRSQGEVLVEIDVACCNYVLLCVVLRSNGLGHLAEFEDFRVKAETGSLYDSIAEQCGLSRSVTKRRLLTYLCGPHDFSRDRLDRQLSIVRCNFDLERVEQEFSELRRVSETFQGNWPQIDAFLRQWKDKKQDHWSKEFQDHHRTGSDAKGPHAVVSRTLQKLESQIVVESCAGALLDATEAAFATIHDCLLVPESMVGLATECMRQSFAKNHLSPTLKTHKHDE